MVMIQDQIESDSFQCISCHWYIGRISSGLACYAFPKGIPVEILQGKFDHRNTYPGDAGIMWQEAASWAKPIEGATA